jgi:16S rRNA (guanine527-N7)-methyltransferase
MGSLGLSALSGLESHIRADRELAATGLEHHVVLLRQWQNIQNLVSRETLPEVWKRHVRDSLQLLPYIKTEDNSFLDLGSGGGFPALVLAIVLKSEGTRFVLIESNKRKCAFLRTVARDLALDVVILASRAEAIRADEIGPVDVITCRATAPLDQLFGLVAPFWGKKTRGIMHKGREHGEEIVKARANWVFDVVSTDSETDAAGAILSVVGLRQKFGEDR